MSSSPDGGVVSNSDSGVSSSSDGAVVPNTDGGVVFNCKEGKSLQFKFLNRMGKSQTDILENFDSNTELVDSILPSIMNSADVDASKVHDRLATTEIRTHTEKNFLTIIECEQLRQFLQQEDSF